MRTAARTFVALGLAAALTAGCAGARRDRRPAPDAPPTDSIQSEIIHTISKRLTDEIPNTGKLKEVRERGILRAALPPHPGPPLHHIDPALGSPRGFHPELAAEIALMLEVKPNISILAEGETAGPEFDIVFLPEGDTSCPPENSLPYFYNPQLGWKHICALDDENTLTEAVAEILSYLNETGIFARLRMAHVKD